MPGRLEDTRLQAEAILRQLRRVPLNQPEDFNLSTSEQIIANFDRVSAAIGGATIGLALVSLFVGGIGIANVMIISVTERTREVGVRIAIGAKRYEVLLQFLLEATLMSGIGVVVGLAVALGISEAIRWLAPGFSAGAPMWVIAAGLTSALGTGILAGYWPARRAAGLDPVEALRYE